MEAESLGSALAQEADNTDELALGLVLEDTQAELLEDHADDLGSGE
jgi:hypothetical protein